MSLFNETLGDIWENHLPDVLTQLPTWFPSLLLYLLYIYILLLCAGQIFQLLNNLFPYVCDNMEKVVTCQQKIVDGLCIMVFNLLFRPIYCAVFYIIVHIIGQIINDLIVLFRFISTIISTRFDQSDQQISPAEPDQHNDVNKYHECYVNPMVSHKCHTWWMRKHADIHIRDLMRGHDEMESDLHRNDNNVGDQKAGNLYGNFRKKEGEDPKSIVRNLANLIDIKIKLKELSDDKIYVFVVFNEDFFITTIR